jgi:hypothetical protein
MHFESIKEHIWKGRGFQASRSGAFKAQGGRPVSLGLPSEEYLLFTSNLVLWYIRPKNHVWERLCLPCSLCGAQ